MVELFIGAALGVIVGMAGAAIYFRAKIPLAVAPFKTEVGRLEERVVGLEKALEESRLEARNESGRNRALQEELAALQVERGNLHTSLQHEREATKEKMRLLEESKQMMKEEFENLAQTILEKKSKTFTNQNQENLTHLLRPFREQITDFRKKVEETYLQESKDRTQLHQEITLLKELNQKISTDALNLTNALKGQSKTQGIWGEVILERILEESGLVEGREYIVQGSFKDESGKRLLPDVVIHLPKERHVVVDSKTTLLAYERYINCEEEAQKALHLREYLQSVRAHLSGLSGKRYEALPELSSLDYVLMFLPVEGAFMLLMEKGRELFTEAFDKNVMIVSPSTLLITLKTIQNIWRLEYQNLNAQEIAKRAGDLVDKFAGFIEDMEKIGQQIDRTQGSYEDAMKKLSTGKGNLVRRVAGLSELGVKGKKEIPSRLLEGDEA